MSSNVKAVFVRTGWMTTYAGSSTGECPLGGGKNNSLKKGGGERDNFLPDASGELHGYFAIGRGDQDIDLSRIDGNARLKARDHIESVLVIFIATRPDEGGSVVVGWYSDAVIYQAQRFSEIGKLMRCESHARAAVLVPTETRSQSVPRATAGFSGIGQSNIFYMYESNGRRRSAPWIEEVLAYVLEYDGPNLLETAPFDTPDSLMAAEITEERIAGLSSNAAIRRVVEEHSMALVRHIYKHSRNIELEDCHTDSPFDYRYKDKSGYGYVEVKGSRLKQPAIILTKNEVEFARENKGLIELCVVHSIDISSEDDPIASGGTLETFPQWNPDVHDLLPMQYICKLNRELASKD